MRDGSIVSNKNRNWLERSDIEENVEGESIFEEEKSDTLTRRYQQQNREAAVRFSINALSQFPSDDDPSAAKALKREDEEK